MNNAEQAKPGVHGLTVGGRFARTKEAARRLGFLDGKGEPNTTLFLQMRCDLHGESEGK